MMKLAKVEKDFYKTEDGKYELYKVQTYRRGRICKVWKFYKNDVYIGQPENIKDANMWIVRHESEEV